MSYVSVSSFHDSGIFEVDADVITFAGHVTTTRKLSYRFYSHFHPYVARLVNRLIEESVIGLQKVDTEYIKNTDDGTLKPLPHSTLAALIDVTTVTGPGDDEQMLPPGTQLKFLDGAAVQFTGGVQASLPGKMMLTNPRGISVTVNANGDKTSIPFGTKFVLKGAAR